MNVDARNPNQRDAYVPDWPPERFIVPLLAARIPEVFEQYCKPLHSDARVLDAGCGMQPFRGMLEAAGYHYSSVDAVQNRTGTVQFIAPLDGPIPTALREAAPFDLILCTEVLEHVADWKTAFANFAELLAPKGRIFITCPHFYPLHELPYDFWRPTPYTVEHFAKQNGLQVATLERAGGPWEVLGTLLAETNSYPASAKLMDRVAAKLGRLAKAFINRALLSRWWRSRITLSGPYFLSIIAVLEKPCAKSNSTNP